MPTSRSYPKHLIEFGERKKKVIYLPLFPVFLKKMERFKKRQLFPLTSFLFI